MTTRSASHTLSEGHELRRTYATAGLEERPNPRPKRLCPSSIQTVSAAIATTHRPSELRRSASFDNRETKILKKQEPSKDIFSRTKIEQFIKCQRCFSNLIHRGIDHPPGFPFTLNNAVDQLLKNEFDLFRKAKKPHPLLVENGITAIPADHPSINDWRNNFKGVRYTDHDTGMTIYGAIDDLLFDPATGQYHVVDFKATSIKDKITRLDKPWHESYKRQMEIYQWLLRKNGLNVSDKGYIIYCNGIKTGAFNNKLEFATTVIPYDGKDDWIEPTLQEMKKVVTGEKEAPSSLECSYCHYVSAINASMIPSTSSSQERV